jgi:hypothetical protein
MVELQRIVGDGRGGAEAALWINHRPGEVALRSPNANLIRPTRDVGAHPREKPQTANPAVCATLLASIAHIAKDAMYAPPANYQTK